MKRDDLEKLGLTAEALEKAELSADVIDKIMSLHGKDIETHKTKITEATTAAEALKDQLAAANAKIEGFNGMKSPEEVANAINEWKTKLEQAQTDAAATVARLRFDHALHGELAKAKVKNVKAVMPLLDVEALQKGFNEKDDTFLGLDKQIEALKQSDAYLFDAEEGQPRFMDGTQSPPVGNDSFLAAAMRGAGIKLTDGK